jgi:autoinducer 2-degrading protein
MRSTVEVVDLRRCAKSRCAMVAPMYAVHVTIQVVSGQVEAFLAATEDNHRHTRAEPGNRRFDVLQDLAEPDRCYLYEIYDDEAAFKAHQQTAHYLRWRETVAQMMASPRTASKARVVHPEPWS